MKYAQWEHWKHPRTKKWDGHSHKNGRVLFASRQGYNREHDLLRAIEATAGMGGLSARVEFKDRVRSPK